METRTKKDCKPLARVATKTALRLPSFPSSSPVEVHSNHFTPKFLEKASVYEYYIRFVKQSNRDQLNRDPNFVDDESVVAQARKLMGFIKYVNEGQVKSVLGETIIAPPVLYAIDPKSTEEQFVFDKHSEFLMVVKIVGKLSWKSMDVRGEASNNLIRFFNIFVKEFYSKKNFVEFGKNKAYYDPSAVKTIKIDGNIEINLFKTYKTSFELYDSGLKMLMNPTFKIIQKQNVWMQYKNTPPDMKEEFLKNMIGMRVSPKYTNGKTIVIDGYEETKTPKSKFPNPKFKDFNEYFKKTYSTGDCDPTQFLIYTKAKFDPDNKQETKNYFIPELLVPVGLPDELRNNKAVMNEISKETIVQMSTRMGWIFDQMKEINDYAKKSKLMLNFDLKTAVKARQIEAPKMITSKDQSKDQSKQGFDLKLVQDKCEISNWIFVYDKFNEKNSYEIENLFKKFFKEMNVTMNVPEYYQATDTEVKSPESLWKNLKDSFKSIGVPKMIFLLFNRKNSSISYSKYKSYFSSIAIPIQFCCSYQPDKPEKSHPTIKKISSQILNKIGYNSRLLSDSIPESLIIGADVCHASSKNSAAAVTSSFGPNYSRHYGTPILQKKGQEVMPTIAAEVIKHVENYKKVMQSSYPKYVIFFRDGVGEGQLREIKAKEVDPIVRHLKTISELNPPKLMFIIVTKRLDDKFSKLHKGEFVNPNSGLIVEREVVLEPEKHFLMVSQQVTRGCATPTGYQVIHDDTGLEIDLAAFTFEQTHTYQNWEKAVKIPSVTQNAHKLCDLISKTRQLEVPEAMKSSLYYL